jgi:hypothetical protein
MNHLDPAKIRYERRKLRDQLAIVWEQKQTIDALCDDLAGRIEDCNIRLSAAHALEQSGGDRKPLRLAIERIDEAA